MRKLRADELCNKRLNKEEDGEELAPVRKKVKTAGKVL